MFRALGLRVDVEMEQTSALPDAEVEGRAGLWGDAEVNRGVLPSMIFVNGPQDLNNLQGTQLVFNVFFS